MTVTHSTMTAEDLWGMPEDGRRHELIHGELTTMAPTGGGHGRIAHKTALRLGTYVEANQLGEVVAAETGFILSRNPDTVRAPDVAFISKSRLPPEGLPEGYVPFAPDIAVEVLSPSDSHIDVQEKTEQWLAAGTAMVWIVNPRARTITVHRPGRDPRILRPDDTLEGHDVCPGFAVKVAEIFDG